MFNVSQCSGCKDDGGEFEAVTDVQCCQVQCVDFYKR